MQNTILYSVSRISVWSPCVNREKAFIVGRSLRSHQALLLLFIMTSDLYVRAI